MLSSLKDIARRIGRKKTPDLHEESIEVEHADVHFELEMPLAPWSPELEGALIDAQRDASENPDSAEFAEILHDFHWSRNRRLTFFGKWSGQPGERLSKSDAAFNAINDAVQLTHGTYEEMNRRCSKFAILQEYQFARAADIQGLELAIGMALGAVKETPEGHPSLPHRLTNLANMEAYRFERKGWMLDIDLAVENAEKALKCLETMRVEERDYLKGRLMRNVAIKLEMRDQTLSSKADLDDAILKMEVAIKSMNQDHPDLALFKCDLCNMKASRFRRTKNITTDLDKGIKILESNLEGLPENHSKRALLLDSLANRLLERYQSLPNRKDLDEVIEILESTLEGLPKNHSKRVLLLDSLANRLLERYQSLHNRKDLDKSIKTSYKVWTIVILGHPARGKYWLSLVSKYIVQARDFPSINTIAEARGRAFNGPKLLEGDRLRAEELEYQGDAILMKHNYVRDSRPCSKAFDKYIEAISIQNGAPLTLIRTHKKLVECYMKIASWTNAATVASHAISLWPRLHPRTLSRDDMESVIRHLSGFGSMAAVSIMNGRQSASDALAALEFGRGMMAGLTINSRSDVSILKEQHEDLYKQYTTLQDAISSNSLVEDEAGQSAKRLGNVEITSRNRNIRELDRLIDKIRSLDGFQNFQQPPSYNELVSLAEFGPIVSFNITPQRCDAFLVTREGIQCLRLSVQYTKIYGFVTELVREKKIFKLSPQSKIPKNNQRLREILRQLWELAVEPVLSRLELLSTEPPARLPRIWWVTSGLMGLLPLHAAGSNWGASRENAASHVVSSYVPTFRALTYARQKKLQSLLEPGGECIIVSMPNTDDEEPLKVAKEVNAVKSHLESQGNTISLLEMRSEKDVREKLRSASIAHFACHGKSNALDPSDSGLLLVGGRLTVRKLAAMALDRAQIAYLSACSTAENSADYKLVDESIHIASAFQLIGFPHVIGTLWPARDKIAEVVAPKFYKSLTKHLQDGMSNNDSVAYALDDAIKSWWGGRRTKNVITWCPFVHIGA